MSPLWKRLILDPKSIPLLIGAKNKMARVQMTNVRESIPMGTRAVAILHRPLTKEARQGLLRKLTSYFVRGSLSSRVFSALSLSSGVKNNTWNLNWVQTVVISLPFCHPLRSPWLLYIVLGVEEQRGRSRLVGARERARTRSRVAAGKLPVDRRRREMYQDNKTGGWRVWWRFCTTHEAGLWFIWNLNAQFVKYSVLAWVTVIANTYH